MTLSVILVITILISFIFYFFNKEDKLDKDDTYENKIANRKSATSDEQKRMVSLQTMRYLTRVGNKIIEDGGNAVDAAEGVAYALAVTEPHSSGLGGGGATLTYDGKNGEEPRMYEYKTTSSFNYKREIK